MAAGTGRDARRRRILEGSGSSPPPDAFTNNLFQDLKSNFPSDQPSASHNEEDKPSHFLSSAQDQAAKYRQNDALVGRSEEERFVRKSEPNIEPSRAPATEHSNKGEPSPAIPKAVLTATDAALRLAQQIPISNLTSQQVSVAVAETEQDRMLCALIMAILVVLSSAGFPIVSNRVLRWFILFRPLFVVLITNITFIVWRLLPENRKNLARGVKEDNSLLGDGYAWAEEAGRALELGLMLQNVVSSLFMDCTVYATIVVFGLSLFG